MGCSFAPPLNGHVISGVDSHWRSVSIEDSHLKRLRRSAFAKWPGSVIETIKVNLSLGSPASGKIVEINPDMETAPEAINQDPYGKGWIAVLEAHDWEAGQARVLDAQAYFAKMKAEGENEVKKR